MEQDQEALKNHKSS